MYVSEFLKHYSELPNSLEYKGLVLRKVWLSGEVYTSIQYITNTEEVIFEFKLLNSQLIDEVKLLVDDFKSDIDKVQRKALTSGRL